MRDFEDDELIHRINVTPLVDVVLVLLVVLMVAATAALSQIPVAVPTPGEPGGTSETLAVSLSATGELHVDREPISERELRLRVRTSPRPKVLIRADGRIDHASVVRLMDLLRREGVRDIAMSSQ